MIKVFILNQTSFSRKCLAFHGENVHILKWCGSHEQYGRNVKTLKNMLFSGTNMSIIAAPGSIIIIDTLLKCFSLVGLDKVEFGL